MIAPTAVPITLARPILRESEVETCMVIIAAKHMKNGERDGATEDNPIHINTAKAVLNALM